MRSDFISVYSGSRKAGELREKGRGVLFAYDGDWLENGFPLSLAMPLTPKVFDEDATEAFFGNLLPEEGLLDAICRAKKLSRHDLIGFLRLFGRECAGAFTIADEPPLEGWAERVDITETIGAHLRERAGANLFLITGSRLSLAGAQDKLPVIWEGGRFFISTGYEPTTHILKPDNPVWPGQARNEHFCMELACACGCNVAETILIPGADMLLVRRFDRVASDTGVQRLHQEDFCQALGLVSQYKYQQAGGYDGIPALRDACLQNGIPVGDFLARAAIMTCILGNFDAHAKNLSILHTAAGSAPAPLYDLLSTAAWPGLDRLLAMAFGRSWTVEGITVDDMLLAAEDCGMTTESFLGLVEEMTERAMAALTPLVRHHSERYGSHPIYERIAAWVENDCKKLQQCRSLAVLARQGASR